MKTLDRICFLGAALLSAATPAGAMSADSSAYAVVLPYVISAPAENTQTSIFVENHTTSPIPLLVHYVGEWQSANPGLLRCSEQNLTPAPQTFTLTAPASAVVRFDLRALLEQKCAGSRPPSAGGDRGTVTVFARNATESTRISALARIERSGAGGISGFSEPGIPLGALEGSTQTVTGARTGAVGGAKQRTECLISSFFDFGNVGNLYRVNLKDQTGSILGSTVIPLGPWSAEYVPDIFAAVGISGVSIDGAQVEFVPSVNQTNPSMVASCRVVESSSGSSTYLMGKVYEPNDLLRRREVTASQTTPGVGNFMFQPGARSLHAVFLRHPDLVECRVSDPQLTLTVTAPDKTVVTGGFQSTLEFFTRQRQEINNGVADAWLLEVKPHHSNPPTGPIPYTLSCVSGNGMSQLDKL